MRPRYPRSPEETINRLESDLYMARTTIISLMSEDLEQILTSYRSATSKEDRLAWDYKVATQIAERTKPLPRDEGSYLQERAYCPLCGDGSTAPYGVGFSLPEGLRRHLTGWGNVGQCRVMEAATEMARDYWYDKFHAADEAEKAERQALVASRRRSETLYRTGPDDEPLLIDEAMFMSTPRISDELAWAERRLVDLGFEIIHEANVKTYKREYEDFVVYADPRETGKIKFAVHKKSDLEPRRGQRTRMVIPNRFSLMDNWKRDILAKFERQLPRTP